jgi:hypothetical protein
VVVFFHAAHRLKGARRTARAESSNFIVVAAVRSESVRRPDDDDGRVVARLVNRAVDFVSSRVFSVVSGGGDDYDDAGGGQFANGDA